MMKQKIFFLLTSSWFLALYASLVFVFVFLPAIVYFFTTIQNDTVFIHKSLRYVFYLMVYGIFLLLITLLRKLFSITQMKQIEEEDRLLHLELKFIKNRMDPHFIFNTMGLISNLVLKGDKMEAYTCITKFSGLLRETLDFSEVTGIRLSDELALVKKYIEIEIMRFSDKFKFKIEIDENVNLNHRIPKGAIMTYAEAAIKQGLFHKEKDGLLLIKILRKGIYTSIEITDNGIGRKEAERLKGRKKRNGEEIMKEYFEIFNGQNKVKLEYSCTDLFDANGAPSGTKVQIDIPENFTTMIAYSGTLKTRMI